MRRFLPFLLLLLVIAAILRADFVFTIFYLFFAVYLLSHLWARRMAANLRVGRSLAPPAPAPPARAFWGDHLTVAVRLQNAGRLPIPWLHVREVLPIELSTPALHEEVVSLGPHERREVRYTLRCRRRGYYAIGPLRVRTGDLLGVADPGVLEVAPGHLIVYPRIVPLPRLGLPTRSPWVALPARWPLFEDPLRIMGVRDYQRGDSPRRMHWSASASAGRLLVKQYQPAIARETLLCLDLDEASYDVQQRYSAVELALVVAASIAHHVVVRERQAVGLVAEAWDPLQKTRAHLFLPPRRESAHLVDLLGVLGRVQVTPATPFPQLLRRASVDLGWGTTLAVVTSRTSAALLDTLAYLRRSGFAVNLILVQSGRLPEDLEQRAGRLGVPIRRVWSERELETWR